MSVRFETIISTGFSPVLRTAIEPQPLQRFGGDKNKPLKQLSPADDPATGLKPGANRQTD